MSAMLQEPVDQLPIILKEWAEWFETTLSVGYSDSTTLYRALFGYMELSPQSSEPRGVKVLECDPRVKRADEAIRTITSGPSQKNRGYVISALAVYLVGGTKAGELLGAGRNKLYADARAGEALIRQEMKLR